MNGLMVALSAVFGGAVTAVVAAVAQRRRTASEAQHFEAQAVDVISRAAADFVERSTKQSERNEKKLEEKIVELESKVDSLTQTVAALSSQLTAAGLTPVASPDAWRT